MRLSIISAFLFLSTLCWGARTNLSLTATVAASASDAGHDVALVKDNRYASNGKYWSSYHGDDALGQWEWLELSWARQNIFDEIKIWWVADGANVLLPEEAYVAWWDGAQWQRGADLAVGQSGQPASTTVDMASKTIRVYMRSAKACGIRELQAWGDVDASVAYSWPEYSPTLAYDYRDEYPALDPPTKMLPENVGAVGSKADGWWCVAWGNHLNHNVTETAKTNLLAKMNTDFAFFRDVMGWPPDKRARNGYYSTVYIYGSGLTTDGADQYERGGWQSATNYNGQNWPMVSLSYYPVACFEPNFTYDDNPREGGNVGDPVGQQNACVHEGIHAIFADLEGCKGAAWYNEAGNTWLQAEAELVRTGQTPTSMGYLSAGNMIAPFMPIECYSGWLLDNSFGGPAAQGVNMYGDNGQICTWRNLLGGVQYGELFPHFVSEILGRASIPWIWRYCKNCVLDGMATKLGDEQMRRLILEYRAKQAMVDVGQWSTACRKLLDDNWLLNIEQEWSPYWIKVEPWKASCYSIMSKCDETDSIGWWKPEWRTTPGWSGANQIPLHVNGVKGNTIRLHFKPLGSNMVCMLCYRTKQGKVYYSYPTEGEGDVVMKLEGAPANNVVIAVVVNTDYIYVNDQTRKQHFDYRLQMGENIYQPAKASLKWYNYKSTIKDYDFVNGIAETKEQTDEAQFTITPGRGIVRPGESLPIRIGAATRLQVPVRMFDASGRLVYQQSFMRDGDFQVPSDIAAGMYILQAVCGDKKASAKIIVK